VQPNVATSRQAILSVVAIAACTVALGVALGALALAFVALNKGQTDAKRIHALQVQLRAAAPTLSSASAGVSAEQAKLAAADSQISSLEGKLSRLSGAVSSLTNCIPEMQAEIGGLEIKGETYSAAYISNGTHTSLTCSSVLYGSGR
jgi:uncharacterized protein HemX